MPRKANPYRIHRIVREKDSFLSGTLVLLALARDGSELGQIQLDKQKVRGQQYLKIAYAGVTAPGHGIGTKLYEAAAKVACRSGRPLISDNQRTRFSEGFWKKQVRKGRARCLVRTGSVRLSDDFDEKGRWGCGHYILTCNGRQAPRSLAGVVGGKKKGK